MPYCIKAVFLMRRVINEKLVSLIVAILAMVAILFGVKNMLQAKESTEE